ncbi:uncharacterized protein E6C27_scaffold274G005650 [Cucumis melo var. makuwa]|uniref:Uncharacterized protein n=1 Tax=Cucumis melo var. makuwa TaxID=1194695 RepID=A0A5A7USV6_CUCMM|nr:uncharacterized protein E6C27_scaffold274G005650 [Cucumis melo var. makuwa]
MVNTQKGSYMVKATEDEPAAQISSPSVQMVRGRRFKSTPPWRPSRLPSEKSQAQVSSKLRKFVPETDHATSGTHAPCHEHTRLRCCLLVAAQRDRLVELEEQMLYLAEVPDSIRCLESRLEEIAEKTDQSMRLSGFVAHMEERVNELDSFHKTLLEMINNISEDFLATLNVVRNEIQIDAKALENYIFDLEQYFRATNTVIEEAKVTLATMHLSKDAKL